MLSLRTNRSNLMATDAWVTRLVYELYGLTEEETRIVEGEG